MALGSSCKPFLSTQQLPRHNATLKCSNVLCTNVSLHTLPSCSARSAMLLSRTHVPVPKRTKTSCVAAVVRSAQQAPILANDAYKTCSRCQSCTDPALYHDALTAHNAAAMVLTMVRTCRQWLRVRHHARYGFPAASHPSSWTAACQVTTALTLSTLAQTPRT